MNRIDEIKKSYDECLFKSTSMVQDVGFLLTVIDDMKAALEFYKNKSGSRVAQQTLTKYFGSGK